jgi:hypothetical protein
LLCFSALAISSDSDEGGVPPVRCQHWIQIATRAGQLHPLPPRIGEVHIVIARRDALRRGNTGDREQDRTHRLDYTCHNSDLRYFFRRRVPPCSRLLLIESGSRHLIEKAAAALQSMFGSNIEIDVVTCYVGTPVHVNGSVYNVNEYGGPAGRNRLLADLTVRGHTIAGILCSAEPIMTKWKWWLAAKLPAKLIIINENGDFFWFDRTNFGVIRQFVAYRMGLTGTSAVPSLVRLVCFPLTLTYLLLYAGTVHFRRKLRTL